MKDFYDIWELSRAYEFDKERLAKAIKATFERRNTEVPAEPPDALKPDFANDAGKQQQWNAFAQALKWTCRIFPRSLSICRHFSCPSRGPRDRSSRRAAAPLSSFCFLSLLSWNFQLLSCVLRVHSQVKIGEMAVIRRQ